MDSNKKSKWQVRLAALLIFIIGFIAGALAMNLYRGRPGGPSSFSRGDRFERLAARLDLTPDQKPQVKQIFDDAHARFTEIRKESGPKYAEVRKQTNERLQAVLTPEQWEKFQQMANESRGRRRHPRETDGK